MYANAKVKSPENVKAVKMRFEHNDGLASFWWNRDFPLLLAIRCFNAALWNRGEKKKKNIKN